jgi:alginate O-acetyltransferase complex protein AlgI
MLFNSVTFAVFFIAFFLSYWFIFNKVLRLQNLLILLGSYVFYGCWNWHFLSLLIGYSLINFVLGFYIDKAEEQKTKKLLVFIGVFVGLGLLFYFKYTNFFITSFLALFAGFHINLNVHTINIILPLGISFYTFRTLSYLFDIHNNKMKPTADWVVFFSFVAFFPCLLSGPIDRAKTLIPQLEAKRVFNYVNAAGAMRQVLWGLFKKVVIADNLTQVTDRIYTNYHTMSGSSLLVAVFYFPIQIYADFSGYSDIAIGVARLLGFNVAKNFNYPFFAQNIAEFWRTRHISLTSWLTEYVFTPLSISFRDYGKTGLILAILINFTLIGIWHGANFTFVLFGFLHGCYYIPLILNGTLNKKRKINRDNATLSFKEFKNMLLTFTVVSFTFILFKSESLADAFGFVRKIFSTSLLMYPENSSLYYIPVIITFLLVEWINRNKEYALENFSIKWSRPFRWALYTIMCILILGNWGMEQQFIYFKF